MDVPPVQSSQSSATGRGISRPHQQITSLPNTPVPGPHPDSRRAALRPHEVLGLAPPSRSIFAESSALVGFQAFSLMYGFRQMITAAALRPIDPVGSWRYMGSSFVSLGVATAATAFIEGGRHANRACDLEEGPIAPLVGEHITRLIQSQPVERRKELENVLAKNWEDLREPFYQLHSGDREKVLQGAVALSKNEDLNRALGLDGRTPAEGAVQEVKQDCDQAGSLIDMLGSPMGGRPDLIVMNEGQYKQAWDVLKEVKDLAAHSPAVYHWASIKRGPQDSVVETVLNSVGLREAQYADKLSMAIKALA